MRHEAVYGATLPEAYHKALYNLEKFGEIVECPDWNTSRKELMMTMTVLHPFQEPMISKFFIGGPYDLERYRQEMLNGIMDFEVDKGKWAYTYHGRMTKYPVRNKILFCLFKCKYKNQIDFIIDELKRNPYSTRAVIDVRDNSQDMYSNDPACLQHIQYFIRNNKLDCAVLFRSNDAVEATFMNAFALIMLQKQIADKLDLEVGTYTHTANSFHCYEKNFKSLTAFCSRWANQDDAEELAFNYKHEWEDYMKDEQETVSKVVAELKSK